MIAEFDRIAVEPEREIKLELDCVGIHDPAHLAYPTYAKAGMGRRANLKRAIGPPRWALSWFLVIWTHAYMLKSEPAGLPGTIDVRDRLSGWRVRERPLSG